jgi:hypothetical protein
VVAKSSMASDWVRINALASVIAIVFATLFLLISFNLESSGYLGIFGQWIEAQNYSEALFLANMVRIFAIFLIGVIIAGIILGAYAYKRKYVLVEESIRVLP